MHIRLQTITWYISDNNGYISPGSSVLTPWGRVVHLFISELGHHWIRQWLVTCSAPSHYLNEYWHNVNCTLRNISEWHFIWNSKVFIPVFENVVCKMSTILSRSQCFNKHSDALHQCLFNASWPGTIFWSYKMNKKICDTYLCHNGYESWPCCHCMGTKNLMLNAMVIQMWHVD